MDSHELPELYMPWPARVSPDLDVAREHAREWARDLGMFEPGGPAGWTVEHYERCDFPLFVALVHADARGEPLNAMTCFYVWSFYFDDVFFRTFTPRADLAGARAYVARLPAFMPIEGEPTETPANAVECGLSDAWTRIAFSKSAVWRERFGRHIQDMCEAWLWELANAIEERVPDPIDYVEMRRRTGGMHWLNDFVEYTLGIELPERVYDARAIRALNDISCDTVLLRNDILSLRKELEQGESNNAVLVTIALLGCDMQAAVDIVSDVVTARLQLAEHVIATEVGPMLDEQALTPAERAAVAAYVQGLRDALAGDFQWETGTGRYHDEPPVWLPPQSPVAGWIPTGPRGLGTAAARVGLTPRIIAQRVRAHAPALAAPAGATSHTPALPFDARCNPRLSELRARAHAWPRAMGMLGPEGWGAWDRARFDELDLALFAAATHPDAEAGELALVCDWHVWAFYFDDFFAAHCKRTRNAAAARALVARPPALMDGAPPAPHPVERGLADLWARSAVVIGDGLRVSVRAHVVEFAESWLWELANLTTQRVPEPVDYVAMRRRTARTGLARDLVCHARGIELAPSLTEARALRTIEHAFADAAGFHNDLVSDRFEAEREGDPNSGVLVLARFLDCDHEQAAGLLARLAATRVAELLHAVDVELPVLIDAHPQAGTAATSYARGLQDWLAGALHWSRETGRYGGREPDRGWMAPTGFGTSAARVALTVGRRH
jgi:germacradienol/geosmin synthase